jgi:GTPase SAR1 family protein
MKIDEKIINCINNTNRNVLILGKAGCGKSTLIKELCSMRNDIIVTAPTGIAGQNINGKTIHSYFGIKPNDYFTSSYRFKKLRSETVKK